jgi:hypothetical protein
MAAAGVALVAAATAACGGTHRATTTTTVTVTTTAAQSVTPVTPVIMPPSEMRQWVNAGQLDFYVYFAFGGGFGTDGLVQVTMWVKNTSSVPQTYMAAAQGLVDDQGRVFAPTLSGPDGTTTSDPPGGAIDQFDLNPGMASGKVYLAFTVPPGTRLEQYSLVVHGSPTSIGSPIRLHPIHE